MFNPILGKTATVQSPLEVRAPRPPGGQDARAPRGRERIRKTLPIWCAVLLLVSLHGCYDTPGDGQEITFWAMGREGEVVQQLIPGFLRDHPGVRVKVQQIPWSAAHEKLLTAYAGGNLPDIVQLGNTWLAEFVAIGALQALDARLALSERLPAHDYFPATLAANRLDGVQYGLPWYVDTRVMFYRRDLLQALGIDEPPRDWPGWLAALQRLQTARLAEYGLLLPLNEWELPVMLAWQEGAELLRDQDRYGNFRSAPFRRAFAFYLSLYRARLTPSISNSQLANLHQEFARGYFAAFITGPWNVGELRRRLTPTQRSSWSTAPLPARQGQEPGLSLAGGASLALSRHSRHPDAAWDLLEYLSQPAQQIRFYQLTGDLPPRLSSWQDPVLAEDPALSAFRRQLSHLHPAPPVPEWERIAAKIAYYSEQSVRGVITPEQALDALDQDTDAILTKRRWLMSKYQYIKK